MELYKASDFKKVFVNWSQGTLYNRIEKLGIKDNDTYIIKNNTTGNVLYNNNAFTLLKENYIKEFSIDTENDLEQFDNHIKEVLSKVSNKVNSNDNGHRASINKKAADKNDNSSDNNDINKSVNDVNISYINENYVSKQLHNEMTNALKKQIEFLENQLEQATANNQELVNTIKLREQTDFVIEQQNLVKLQQATEIKELGTQEDNKGGWVKRFLDGIFNKRHIETNI